jgi:hypothetical protein
MLLCLKENKLLCLKEKSYCIKYETITIQIQTT